MNADPYSLAQARSHVPGVTWPPLSTGSAATLAALLDELDRSQWLDPATIRDRQFGQLRVLAEHCATHSPQFARRLGAAGLTAADLATPEGLARLPILSRREVQAGGDLFCGEVPAAHRPISEVHTSGSTGEPVRVRRTAVTQLMWLALTLRDQFWHRRDLKGRQCSIRATTDKVLRFGSWGGLMGELFETGEVLVIPTTMPLPEQLATIDEYRPDILLTYPNQIAALIEQCRARGRGFEGLGHLRTLGETLSPALREEAAAILGAPVTDSYSAQEIGVITLECPDSPTTHHIMAETVLVELLRDDGTPCDEGELGRVVVTDLLNLATPMIRYDLGDYAEAGPPCSCGRGLPVLRRIAGRERNLVQLPDGRRHWPWFGNSHLRDVAPVRQLQVIQHSVERIEVRLVCERVLTDVEEADVRAAIGDVLDHDFAIDLHYFEESLPVGANGKFEEFICLIDAEGGR